jgi:hypothetical protein
MASEFGSPKAPQADLVTVSGTNNRARLNAYTDPNLTTRNVVMTADAIVPPKSGSRTLGDIRPVYANDTTTEIENDGPFPEQTPPPQAPNSWPIVTDAASIPRSRDPYRNGGMIGQPFFG